MQIHREGTPWSLYSHPSFVPHVIRICEWLDAYKQNKCFRLGARSSKHLLFMSSLQSNDLILYIKAFPLCSISAINFILQALNILSFLRKKIEIRWIRRYFARLLLPYFFLCVLRSWLMVFWNYCLFKTKSIIIIRSRMLIDFIVTRNPQSIWIFILA